MSVGAEQAVELTGGSRPAERSRGRRILLAALPLLLLALALAAFTAFDSKLFGLIGDNPPPGFTKALTFEEVDGGTQLTLVCTFDKPDHKDAVVRRGFSLGTNQSFDKLEAHLATL